MNAAEVWGCDWTEIRDAEVWAVEKDERAVPIPRLMKEVSSDYQRKRIDRRNEKGL